MNDEKIDAAYESTRDVQELKRLRDVVVDDLYQIMEKAIRLRHCVNALHPRNAGGDMNFNKNWFLVRFQPILCDIASLDIEFRERLKNEIWLIEGNKGGQNGE
jgi:hypothetical protein